MKERLLNIASNLNLDSQVFHQKACRENGTDNVISHFLYLMAFSKIYYGRGYK